MTDFGTRPAADVTLEGEQETITLVDGVVFDVDAETYTATGVDVSDYRDFLLLIDLAVVGAPTDLQIQVRFSDDDSKYRQYMNGPFGDLRYEDAAGAKAEAIHGKCLGPYMDIHVISTGCDGSKTFTLTVKAVLSN